MKIKKRYRSILIQHYCNKYKKSDLYKFSDFDGYKYKVVLLPNKLETIIIMRNLEITLAIYKHFNAQMSSFEKFEIRFYFNF